ncbi:MAG TPA: DMT family transporter [Anaerovoracaceae bacterium]|nr:DMT family transporter [Anaerovoracaceae bacterium]
MNNKVVTIILTVLAALAWGLSFFFTIVALKYFDPISLLGLRWGIAGLLFAIFYFVGFIKCDFKGKNIKPLIAAGLLQPCLYSIFETTGIGMTSTSESAIIIAMIPIFTLIVSVIIYKKRLSKLSIFAVVIAFSGIVVCTYFSPEFTATGKLLGYLVLFGAVICSAFYTHSINNAGKSFTSTEITLVISISGGVFFTILNFIFGDGFNTYVVFINESDSMFSVIFLGIACSFLCYLAFNNILTKFSPVVVTNVFINGVTLIGIISGVVLAGDPFGLFIVIGAGMTMTGITLTTLTNNKKNKN